MYYCAYSCILNLIRVLRNLYLSYGTYTCVTELILVFRIVYLYNGAYSCTKVPVGTTHIHYTEVPVGTTGLILILQELYLFYQYGSTRRYYRDFTCTEVPIGTTEQIQRYPYVHSDLYHIHSLLLFFIQSLII